MEDSSIPSESFLQSESHMSSPTPLYQADYHQQQQQHTSNHYHSTNSGSHNLSNEDLAARKLQLYPDRINQQRRRSSSNYQNSPARQNGNRTPGGRSGSQVSRSNYNNNNNGTPRRSTPSRRGSSSSPQRAEGSELVALRHAAFQPGATQETIKEYVQTLLESHVDTVGAWDKRVRVAESYRNKQLRLGGEAVGLRPSDQGFLEKVEVSSEHYMNLLESARQLLEVQREVAEDRKDTVGRAWYQYCSRYHASLHDLWLEVSMIYRRILRLLGVEKTHDRYTPKKFKEMHQNDEASARRASRANSVASLGQRSRSNSVAGPSGGSRRGSVQNSGILTAVDGSPLAKLRQRSSSIAQQQRANSPAGRRQSSASVSQVRRGSEVVRPGVNGRLSISQIHPYRLSIAAEEAPSTTLSGRPLNPRTSLPGSLIGSPYDEKTPYGRLSPYRFDPNRTAADELVIEDPPLPPGEVQELEDREELILEEGEPTDRSLWAQDQEQPSSSSRQYNNNNNNNNNGEGNSLVNRRERSGSTRRGSSLSQSRCRRASQVAPEPEDCQPQLNTYYSHRGPAPVVVPHTLTPERRAELLEIITAYTTSADELDKYQLKGAKGCFMELYGPQRGMQQYSRWLDDLALQSLRNKK